MMTHFRARPLQIVPSRMSARRGLLIASLTSVFLAAGFSAAEAKRLALVVGNADYTTVPALKNAVNDAEDVAAAFKRLGFEVTLLTDVSATDFWDRVDAFSEDAKTAEATVFFYSGHAFQLNGVNYLVPVDAKLDSRESIRTQTWDLDGIIARLQDRKRQTLIFLDACRNDPLPQSVRGSGSADGLARLQTGVGTFVAFATEPGAVTYDGTGDAPNSPFTTALLENVEEPGLSISDMMIKVRNKVSEETLGRQTPWDQSSLREQFYFQAPTETKQELSEADYEMLALLAPDDRAKFLELLRNSGFSEESLQQADDAITIASYNLEVAAEADTIIGAVTPGQARVLAPTVPEFDIASLETVDGGVTVDTTAPTLDVAVAEPATPEAPPVAEVAPEIETPVETDVAELQPEAVAPAAPSTDVAALPVPEPEAPQVAEIPVDEPEAPVAVAEAAPAAPETPAAEPEEPVDVAEAVASAPALPESIASVPETVIALLPTPDSPAPLGAETSPLEPPVRLAALTWETRGILELNAVDSNRTRVTGNEITPDNESNREILAAIDPSLLDDTGIVVDTANLSRDAQAELSRLGCYRMTVDGAWGRGSRTALTSYFLAKRQVPDSLEPSVALVEQLKREGQVVCEVQVARAKVVVGKTKPILAKAVQAKATNTVVRKAAPGRTAVTKEVAKKEIKKISPGSF